ncbi:MAG: hypothetical protein FJ298_05540 [Planctomycetes bacterium]|nr:hypothetical protein [Planctomycetota bacterium]
MDMHCLYQFLATYGPWSVIAVGVGSVALCFLAFGVFAYSELIGEHKVDEHAHGHDDHGHGAHH